MNKSLLILIIAILADCGLWTADCFSQAPAIEWQNTIGGNNYDNLNSIQETPDGGYILGGYSSSDLSGDKTEASMGTYDYWVIKINNIGEIEWQNTIGAANEDYLVSIAQTADEGYILGGFSYSGLSGDKTEASWGLSDFWVIKLDSAGEIVWQNTIGGSGEDMLRSIQQTDDGGYILGGNSKSNISGDKTENAISGTNDYWVIKLNSAGIIEWQNTIGGSREDYLYSIKQTIDGGYILGGYSNSGLSGDKTENAWDITNPYTSDYWVIKLNNTGSIEWQNTIGGTDNDLLYSVEQTADDGYILGGYSFSGTSGDKTETSWSSWGYWVVKINSTGSIEWQNSIGGHDTDALLSVKQTTEGGYILGGYSNSGIFADKAEASLGSFDYWIIELNNIGDIEWQNTIGGGSEDIVRDIIQVSDGGYAIAGYSSSALSGDKTEGNMGPSPTYDYWIIKLVGDCLPTTEICNTIDDNCNGIIDDGIIETISISAGGATTFCQGGNVLLSAVYTGVTLQWKKNGSNIPGATNSNYTATKTGTYTCVTTSPCGFATSTGILITVKPNPPAAISAGGATTFCMGGSVVLTANAGGGLSYQWYKGASAIAGATLINYTATLPGNYKCRVTKTATGCFKNSNVINVSVPCKEGEEYLESNLIIYPNPASEIITIKFNGNFGVEKNIKIYDVWGQKCFDVNVVGNELTIDIKLFSKGIYLLQSEVEAMSTTSKFIKE